MNKCFFMTSRGVRLSKGGTSEQLCFRDLRSEKDIRSIGKKKRRRIHFPANGEGC